MVEFDFMDISSYGASKESSGLVKINRDLDAPLTGKDVLLIEDVIDSGRTLSHLIKYLSLQSPASLKICALLDKPDRRVMFDVCPDYTGFVIPDEFVVGYGLDYNGQYRNLPYIGTLVPTETEKESEDDDI
jgi:hypoxanthine phosphoribosyltransferase